MKHSGAPLSLTCLFAGSLLYAQSDFLSLENRWKVRDFYRHAYQLHPDASLDWTGSHAGLNPGTINQQWRIATRDRIRFFRRMAGVPHDIIFTQEYNELSQEAAFIISINDKLEHEWPEENKENWTYWSAEAAQGAVHSNLAHGVTGANAITGYIIDPGSTNFGVGHRRWFFLPQFRLMGSGDIPATEDYPASNAVYVITSREERMEERHARDDFVAWPPPGYVPSQLVYPRWSFSYPDADFSEASVSMDSEGASISLTIEPFETRNVGEPTIVWVPNGFDTDSSDPWPAPESDEPVTVTISGVRDTSGSAMGPFSYTVTIFDAAEPGPQEFETTLSGPVDLLEGEVGAYSVRSRPWAEQTQVRILETSNGAQQFDAESPSIPFETDLHGDYSPRQSDRVADGDWAFHMVHPDPKIQTLTLPVEYLVATASAKLEFASSLAWATANQVAHVDVLAANEGNEWQSVWSRSGPVETNEDFETVTLDLGDYSGHAIRLRFRYAFTGGNFYNNSASHLGWAIDAIRITGVHTIERQSVLDAFPSGRKAELSFNERGSYFLQARDIAFDGIPLGWGNARQVFVQAHDGPVLRAGQWTTDATLGSLYGVSQPGWAYSENLGWIFLDAYPWIHTRNGWVQAVHGNLAGGLWLYHERHEFIYTAKSLELGPGWYYSSKTEGFHKFSPDF